MKSNGAVIKALVPKQVGKPVEVNQDLHVGQLSGFPKRADPALGTAANRAREIEVRGGEIVAGCSPAVKAWLLGLEPLNPGVQPGGEVGIHDRVAALCVLLQVLHGGCQLPHDRNKVALNRSQTVAGARVLCRRPGQPQSGVQLIDRSAGFHPRVAF